MDWNNGVIGELAFSYFFEFTVYVIIGKIVGDIYEDNGEISCRKIFKLWAI